MDPLLAAAERVVGYLVPYAIDKGVELAKKLGKSTVDRIGGWLDSLREGWAGDEEASGALKDFEENPEENSDRLRDLLADRLRTDEALKQSIERLAKDVGPTVVVTMEGERVEVQVGPEFGQVLRGQVFLTQKLKDGKEQSGPKIDTVG
jgi:hypothetical protein